MVLGKTWSELSDGKGIRDDLGPTPTQAKIVQCSTNVTDGQGKGHIGGSTEGKGKVRSYE